MHRKVRGGLREEQEFERVLRNLFPGETTEAGITEARGHTRTWIPGMPLTASELASLGLPESPGFIREGLFSPQ